MGNPSESMLIVPVNGDKGVFPVVAECLGYVAGKNDDGEGNLGNFPDFEVKTNRYLTGELYWEKRDEDFQMLEGVKSIIDEDLSDADFVERIPEIEKILRSTWLFQQLDDPNITVSTAHKGTTPFAHTIEVLRQLRTDGLDVQTVRAVRWTAIWHDVGKIFGAVLPPARFHSGISAMAGWDYLSQRCSDLSSGQIFDVFFAIVNHHLSEGIGVGWMPWVEASNRLYGQNGVLLWYVLAAADILSIPTYSNFVKDLDNILQAIRPDVYERVLQLGLLRSVLTDPHPSSNGADRQ